MGTRCLISCIFIVICFHISTSQLPPRPLQIPGAVLLQGARPSPLRPQRINTDFALRPRRPNAAPSPVREVRPVVEEEEEESVSPTSNFDSEVNKLGISALSSAVRQLTSDDLEEPTARPLPLPFRPERPVPVTRDQIRDRPSIDNQPRPLALPKPLPVLRQEPRPLPIPRQEPRPISSPPQRPVIRQERPLRQEIDEEDDLPIRQQARKVRPQASTQQFRPAPPPRASRPDSNEDDLRRKKPEVQILRKYRTDNPDGSITWGFENDDGTFKEETLGVDCITRGKYGYFDPDGVRREYSYETGNKCDEQEEQLEEEIPPKKPLNIGKPQPQFRPSNSQHF